MYSSYHLLIDTFFAMLPRYWSFCCKFRAKFRIAVSLPKFALNFVFTWNNGYVGSAKNTHTIYVPGWQTIKAYGSMNIYTYCIHTHVVAWDLCKLLRMWFDLLVWSCQHHGLTSQCLILLWWIRKGSGCLGSLASTSPLDKLWKPHAVKSFLPSSLHMSAPFLGHELASDFLPQPKPINFLKFVLQFRPPKKKDRHGPSGRFSVSDAAPNHCSAILHPLRRLVPNWEKHWRTYSQGRGFKLTKMCQTQPCFNKIVALSGENKTCSKAINHTEISRNII